MVADFDILVPEYTKNLVKNPSFENSLDGWEPAWEQEVTFEDQKLTPNPTGFDLTVGAGLSIVGDKALRGNHSLEVDIFDTSDRNGQLTDPSDELSVTLEAIIDTRYLFMAGGDEFVFLASSGNSGPLSTTNRIFIEKSGADFTISGQVVNDSSVGQNTALHVIQNGINVVRLEWRASSAPAANDGLIRLYANGVFLEEITGVDNDQYDVDTIVSGAFGSIDAGTNGQLILDNIRWAKGIDLPFTGCSLTRTLERARFGRYSLKVETDGNAVGEGPFRRMDTSSVNGQVTLSVYMRGAGKVRLRCTSGLDGQQSVSDPVDLHDDYWQRVSVQANATGTDDFRIYFETAETAQEVTFYIDGVQVEKKGYPTTYCDGDQEGDYRWNGVAHLSTSERTATETDGGKWESIREDDCDPDTYITTLSGFGMPPVTINRQRMALTPGSFYDSERVEERVLQMLVTVKDSGAQKRGDKFIKKVHALRQRLQDLIKSDRDPNKNPFWLRYRQDERFLMIKCKYEGGLEFEGDIRNKWFNQIPLRLLANDPFFYEDNQEVSLLDTEDVIGNDKICVARIDGEWKVPFGGFDTRAVLAIEEDSEGRLYFGGTFRFDEDGNELRRFAKVNDDFTDLEEIATGFNSTVNDIKAHPNGKIYICGDFTGDNAGNLFDRIAEYDPDTDTFSALSGGIDDGSPRKMFIAPNGDVYVVGTFTTVDGSTMNYIAYWDGGSWHTVGNLKVEVEGATGNLVARDLHVQSRDEVYLVGINSGDLSTAGDILWKWDGSTWEVLYTELVSNVASAYVIKKDLDGTYLIGGSTPDVVNSQDGALWRFNGSETTRLGDVLVASDGGNGRINDFDIDSQGNVVIGGIFITGGSLVYDSPIGSWNGSSFTFLDLQLITENIIEIVRVTSKDDVFFGWRNPVDNIQGSGITLVSNIALSNINPIFSFFGTGKLIWLENQTTGQRMYMNYTLQEDEILEIDLRIGEKTVISNYRGNVADAVLPNSDDIFLLAGDLDSPTENKIACFMINEVTPQVQLRYQPKHLSVDAIADL